MPLKSPICIVFWKSNDNTHCCFHIYFTDRYKLSDPNQFIKSEINRFPTISLFNTPKWAFFLFQNMTFVSGLKSLLCFTSYFEKIKSTSRNILPGYLCPNKQGLYENIYWGSQQTSYLYFDVALGNTARKWRKITQNIMINFLRHKNVTTLTCPTRESRKKPSDNKWSIK